MGVSTCGTSRPPIMDYNPALQAKVSGFIPVDMVDGRSDIETAHYFVQIFADGDVYTVRRTVISFVELDRDLTRRFPKLALPLMPIYDIDGAASLKKAKTQGGLLGRGVKDKLLKAKRSEVALDVDELNMLQPRLTQYVTNLMSIDSVLNCEEMRTFLTELSSEVRDGGDDDKQSSTYEKKISVIVERFGKGKGGAAGEGLEQVLLEAVPVVRQKLQPSQNHSVTLSVEEAGNIIVWGFTTLPGKSTPAKDVAFSMTYNGTPVRKGVLQLYESSVG